MQERHSNREQYFKEQEYTVSKHVLSFIKEVFEINEKTSVLEIGCGEGGNLKPFLDIGCERVLGIDLAQGKIDNANKFFENHPNKNNIKFVAADIYDIENIGTFDLIFSRDVLEHIHGQERFMDFIKKFLKPGGKIFMGFPSWQSPFGGHQQICESKVLSKLPYFHILPKGIYRSILKMFGESEGKIENLLEVHDTGITIERFEKILKKSNYKIDKKILYFNNPNYEVKFKLKVREQSRILTSIPYFRNYFITTNYYVVSIK